MHLKNSEKARVTIVKEANRKSREGVKAESNWGFKPGSTLWVERGSLTGLEQRGNVV